MQVHVTVKLTWTAYANITVETPSLDQEAVEEATWAALKDSDFGPPEEIDSDDVTYFQPTGTVEIANETPLP